MSKLIKSLIAVGIICGALLVIGALAVVASVQPAEDVSMEPSGPVPVPESLQEASSGAGDVSGLPVAAVGCEEFSCSAHSHALDTCAPNYWEFRASIQGGTEPYSYSWDFGDGSPITMTQNPTHTYTSPGTYTATLTVTDAANCSDTDTAVIFIEAIDCTTLDAIKYRPHGDVRATYRFWYDICVTNTGTVPATNVLVTDTLPDSIAPYSVRVSPPGAFDGVSTVTWNLDTLDADHSACVWIEARTYSSAAGTFITNRAQIDAQNLEPQGPIVVTDVAFVHSPPPPTRTPTPTPTSTPTPTPTPTSTPTSTPTPDTGGIVTCVWNDLDGDGSRDAGEPPMSGILINLWDSQGQLVDSCTTGASGCCSFSNLPPGAYTVAASAAQGFFFTTVATAEAEVIAGQVSEVLFGSRQWYMLFIAISKKNAP
jgi:PKD repeat protein